MGDDLLLASLLICTKGRTSELARLLASLDAQTCRDFEVVLVDQNQDDRLDPILHPFVDRLPILHLKSSPGLSHGRNVGLPHLKGDIISFPDDDCEYPHDLLARIFTKFSEEPSIAGICGRHVDIEGNDVLARFDHHAGDITRYSVWRRSSSATIFLRSTVTDDVGLFDEQLGVGSGTPWGSGEEIDYLCRALLSGYRLWYDPRLEILHPRPPTDNTPDGRRRASFYSRGMGYVLYKYRFPLWFTTYMTGRPAVGALIDVLRLRLDSAKMRWRVASSRAQGYREGRKAHRLTLDR
jgi:glycosyltransferase involved in cell wall biosynthesis